MKFYPGESGFVLNDVLVIIGLRMLADWKHTSISNLLGTGLNGEMGEGGYLYGVSKDRVWILHACLRAHDPLMEAIARDVSANSPWRYQPLWGSEDLFRTLMRIQNVIKGPSKNVSFDEIVVDSASTSAQKFLMRFPLKNHDWGFAGYAIAGSLEGILSEEEYEKFKGRGWLFSFVLKPGGSYYDAGPLAYYGKAVDLFGKCLSRDVSLGGYGMTIYGDSFFGSPCCAYLSVKLGCNWTGPVRPGCFGSYNLPPEFRDLKEEVKGENFQLGEYASRWSNNAKLLLSFQKSNRVVAFISTCNTHADTGSLKRRVEESHSAVAQQYPDRAATGKKVLVDMETSRSHATYTVDMGHCDSFAAGESSTNHHRKNRKWSRCLFDFAIFGLPVVHTWILWRGADTRRRDTVPDIQEKIIVELLNLESPYLRGLYTTKKKRQREWEEGLNG